MVIFHQKINKTKETYNMTVDIWEERFTQVILVLILMCVT